MNEVLTTWGASIASALALGLSALSLAYARASRPEAALARAKLIGKAAGLKFVYDHCDATGRQALLMEARLRKLEARTPPARLKLLRAEESAGPAA